MLIHDFQQLRCNPVECVFTVCTYVKKLLTTASHMQLRWLYIIGSISVPYVKVTLYAMVAFKAGT